MKSAKEVETHTLNETFVLEIGQEEGLDPLYKMLACTPTILDEIDKIPFIHTLLHQAVFVGNTNLALEILMLKPSLGKKLNANGQSPLHLALDNPELAKRLIECDSELIRVKGREGMTPLHHVARAGKTHLLAEFLCACPGSIWELNTRGENAFHIAAKFGQVEAFKVIFEWMWRTYNGELLSQKDERGNTVLHIAVCYGELEIVKLLVRRAPILKGELNSAGLTALGIAADDEEMKKMLLRKRIEHPRDGKFKKDARNLDIFLLSKEHIFERFLRFFLYSRKDLTLDMRNMVLVVAVLIATATFEAPANLLETENKSVLQVVSNYSLLSLNTLSFTFSIAVMALILNSKPYTTYLHLSLLFMAITYGGKIVKITAWQNVPAVVLIMLVYAHKIYFDNMERRIFTEMPLIWTIESIDFQFNPRLRALPPTPVSVERLRMVYRLMGSNPRSSSSSLTK